MKCPNCKKEMSMIDRFFNDSVICTNEKCVFVGIERVNPENYAK